MKKYPLFAWMAALVFVILPAFAACSQEQAEDARPELVSHIENLDEYGFTGKTIIPFNIHNGSGLSRTMQTIQELEPWAEIVEDAFTINEHNMEDAAGEINSWLDELGY